MNENELMSRLVASKAIMDKSNTIKRGEVRESAPIMLDRDDNIELIAPVNCPRSCPRILVKNDSKAQRGALI